MSWRLDMVPEVRAWLADLAARDPAAGRQAGAAIVALLDQGPELGAPLVTPVAPWPPPPGAPDPREALDDAYQQLLELLTRARRHVAEIATTRERVQVQLGELAGTDAHGEASRLRHRHAELAAAEQQLAERTALLRARVDSFRGSMEAVKAAYTAAVALLAVSEAAAGISDMRHDGTDPGMALTDAEKALAGARADADDLLRSLGDLVSSGRLAAGAVPPAEPSAAPQAEPSAAPPAEPSAAAPAEPGAAPPGVELMIVRPAAPGCFAARILFMVTAGEDHEPGGSAGSGESSGPGGPSGRGPRGEPDQGTVVLLAAGTEHARPGGEPDRLIALARTRAAARAAAVQHSPDTVTDGGYDGDAFVAEFYAGQEQELVDGVAAMVLASQPRALAELRQRAGLTQAQVAARLGVRQERVSAIERGAVGACEVRTLAAYMKALGARLDLAADLGTERVPLG